MRDLNEILDDIGSPKYVDRRSHLSLKIPNAKEVLLVLLKRHIGTGFAWNKEYEEIVSWMENSGGKGLFLYGHMGRGKTVMAKAIIPDIIRLYLRKVVKFSPATEITKDNLKEFLSTHFLSIDDIGTESPVNDFGNKHFAIPEIINKVEQEGRLLIITSNYKEKLKKYYEGSLGDRTIDRIESICKCVAFDGDSFR